MYPIGPAYVSGPYFFVKDLLKNVLEKCDFPGLK